MSPSGRVAFIETVRKALNRGDSTQRSLEDTISNQPEPGDARLLEKIAGRDSTSQMSLLEKLIEAAKSVNVAVAVEKDAASAAATIVRIAAEKTVEWGDEKVVVAWDHPLVRSLSIVNRLKPFDIPVYFPDAEPQTADRQEALRRHAEVALIGITSADHCVAETATLSMKTRPGQPRCVSLLPSIHIAVIRQDQLLSNLNELYTLLKWHPAEQAEGITRCMTFITGPSKTADIEATLVHGAHGPRELYIIVLAGCAHSSPAS